MSGPWCGASHALTYICVHSFCVSLSFVQAGIGSMETHTAASSKGPDSQGIIHGVKGGKAAARAVGATEYAEDTSDDDETNDNATVTYAHLALKMLSSRLLMSLLYT